MHSWPFLPRFTLIFRVLLDETHEARSPPTTRNIPELGILLSSIGAVVTPLIRISLIKGKSQEYIRTVADGMHRALAESWISARREK